MKARQFICGIMATIQIIYPVSAAAGNYYFFKNIAPLSIKTSAPVGGVNIDSSNTSATSVKAGRAILRVAPSQVDFGTVPAGEQATPQTVTLSNVGTGPLTIGTVSTTSQFGNSNNCDGVTLGALSSCQINITFNPTQQDNNTVYGNISTTFEADGATAEAIIQVSGTAAAPLANNNKEMSIGGDATIAGTGESGGGSNGTATLAFAPAIINMQEFTKNITLTASATKPITLSSVDLQGDTTNFAVDRSACPDTIAIGTSCNIVAKFHPTSLGDKSATVVINSDAYNGNSLPISLTGQGIETYGVVDGAQTTAAVDFGTIVQGSANVVKTATIKNKGTGDLTISNVTLVNAPSGITVTNNGCQSPVAPNATCTITMTASSSSTFATSNTSLLVYHDGRLTPTSPLSIPLTGSVVAQTRQLSYDVAEVAFGNVDSGAVTQQVLTITNTGNSTVSPITASVASPFTVPTTTCNAVLAPNASCTITFQLSSSTMGAVSKAITISSTGLTTAATAINATGFIVNRTIAVSATTMAFGLQTSDMWSDEKLVTITNNGNTPVRPDVVGRQADGTFASISWAKVSSNTCSGADVAVGATCQIGFKIKPTSTSSVSNGFTIVPMTGQNSSPYAKTLTVSGQGTTQNYSVSVSSLDYGVVDSMAVVDKVVTVTNTSTNSGTAVTGFSGVSFSQPTGATGTLSVVNNTCATSLAFGATCSFTVRMTANPYIVDGSLPFTGSFSMYYSGARSATTAYPISGSLKGSPISVTMDKQNMGDITYGATVANSPVVRFTVTNTGTGSVKPYGSEFLGQDSAVGLPATSVASTCSNKTLTAGQSCYTDFRFQPTVWAQVGPQTTRMGVVLSNLNSSTTSYVDVTGNILAPELTLGSTTIDMGTVGENSYVDKTISVALTKGDSAVFDQAVSGTGYSLPQVVSTSCTNVSSSGGYYVLNKSSVCNVTIRVTAGVYSTPTLTGTYNAYIRTGTAATVTTRTQTYGPVSLTAAVEAASYAIDYNGMQWDNIPLQEAGYGRYAIVRNTSATAPITINASNYPYPLVLDSGTSTLVHTDNKTYNNCFKLGNVLNPGASCFIKLNMAGYLGSTAYAGTAGPFSGNYTLTTNTKFGSVIVPLSGTFLAGELTTDVTALTFAGDTPSNTVYPTDQVLTITNTGTGNMVFKYDVNNRYFNMPSQYYIVKANGTETSYATYSTNTLATGSNNRCEEVGSLRAGASCKLTIRFHPVNLDTQDWVKTFTVDVWNPAVASKTITLSGHIIAGSLTTTATSFDFGAMATMSSYTKTITVANTGQYAVNVYKIDRAYNAPWTAPAYPNDWSMTHNCPSVMQPGDSCVITVNITPDRNIDWNATKDRVIIYHDNAGVTKYTHLPFTGVSSGAEITETAADMGTIEQGPVDNVTNEDARTITLTSTGTTPVRINTIPAYADSYFKLIPGGTCSANMLLNPGDTCSLKIGYYTDYSAMAFGNNLTRTPTLFTTNGQVKNAAAQISQYSLATTLTYDIVTPVSLTSVNPSSVSNSVDTPIELGAGYVSGSTVTLDDQPFAADGNTQYQFTVPAGASVGSHTIKVRSPYYGAEKSITFNVVNSTIKTAISNAVYTAFKGGVNSVTDSMLLDNGNVVQVVGNSLFLYDTSGRKINSLSLSLHTSTSYWSHRLIKTTSGVVVASAGDYLFAACSGLCTYYSGLALNVERVTISGTTMTNSFNGGKVVFQKAGYPMTYSYVNFIESAISGNTLIISTYMPISGYGGYTQTFNLSNNSWGNLYTTSTSVQGMAADSTNMYLRIGSTIYSYPVSGTVLGSAMGYAYSGTLGTDSSDGLAIYNGTLYVPCGGGVSVCSTPVSSGALGAMTVEMGTIRGYVDGGTSEAQLDIYRLSTNNLGVQITQNAPGLPTRIYH